MPPKKRPEQPRKRAEHLQQRKAEIENVELTADEPQDAPQPDSPEPAVGPVVVNYPLAMGAYDASKDEKVHTAYEE